MIYLSKSKYCGLYQCPRLAWLEKFKPEVKTEDSGLEKRMKTGNEIGDLAMGLFGEFEEVTTIVDGKLDIQQMIEKTQDCLNREVENICEASFSFNGLYCAVDVLRKENGGYAIYEVKSSSKVKEVYVVDVAYQKYVLSNCGVCVTGCYVVNIDTSYVREGDLDIKKLFTITDVTAMVDEEIKNVVGVIEQGERVLNNENEPQIDIGTHCEKFYSCAYWDYCTKHLEKPTVFELYDEDFDKQVELYKQGIKSIKQLKGTDIKINKIQKLQIGCSVGEIDKFLDKEKIKTFISTIKYPISFFDFESMNSAIPLYDGTKPYQQVPFQYSLHILYEDGVLEHKEFLAECGMNPLKEIARSIVENMPSTGSVIAYNKGFESGRLKDLAIKFPEFSEQLLSVKNRLIDLIVPFRSGWYYLPAMGSSFSIKSVLPALFPQDEELNYKNLDGVHNGTEAMNVYPQIQFMDKEQAQKTKEQLLAYCNLDTYALVKVYRLLKDIVAK